MRHNIRWLPVIIILLVPFLASCTEQATMAQSDHVEPAMLEVIEGTDVNRVILTSRAAERLGIETAEIEEVSMDGGDRLTIPYGAVIYDINGATWTYVNPEPLTYHRVQITVDYIEDDTAYLLDGPEIGTAVAYVGVAELYGADTGVGK